MDFVDLRLFKSGNHGNTEGYAMFNVLIFMMFGKKITI